MGLKIILSTIAFSIIFGLIATLVFNLNLVDIGLVSATIGFVYGIFAA